MSTPVRADAPKAAPLTAREEQILALIARGKSNTEIANELGIAFPTAKAHVSHILAKLGVETREEAARWWDTHTEPERPSVFARWVRLLWPLPATALGMVAGTAALVAVAVLGFFALASLLSGEEVPADATPGEASPTPPADESPTSEPSSTTGEGSLAPGLEELGIRELEDAFVRETFPPGTPITQNSGAFFVDTETGEIERISISGPGFASDFNPTAAIVSEDNRLIAGSALLADGTAVWVLFNRDTGQTISWPQDSVVFLASTPTAIILSRTPADASNIEFFLLTRDFQPDRIIELPVEYPSYVGSAVTLDPTHVAFVLNKSTDGCTYRAFILDTSAGEIEEIHGDWPEMDGIPPELMLPNAGAGNGLIALTAQYFSRWLYLESSRLTVMRLYDASGSIVHEFRTTRPTGFTTIDISPDGKLIAWQEYMKVVGPKALGDGEFWPAVVVADAATGESLFRIKGARLQYGDQLGGSRWLADSSGLLVGGQRIGGGDFGSGSIAFYVVSRDGNTVVTLNDGRAVPCGGPVPNPSDPNLIALGPCGFLDLETGEATLLEFGQFDPVHGSPWGVLAPSELRFSLAHGGHDGPHLTVAPAPPVVERPPFDDSLRLAVATGGDCLNLRTLPTADFGDIQLSGEPITCLPDGTIVERADGANLPEPLLYESVVPDFESPRLWIFVRTPDGQTGWVASDFLRWATPADG